MRLKSAKLGMAFLFLFLNTNLWADQIVLKDGKTYSGKFIRGDSNSVDFRILGRIESFKTADIDKIVFKEPELGVSSGSLKSTPSSKPAQADSSGAEAQAKPQPANQEEPALENADSATTLSAGTPVKIRTTVGIDTDRNRVGDIFDAILEENLVSNNRIVVSRGVTVKGKIAYAKESGKLTGQSELILELTELVVSGRSYAMRTSDYSEVGASRGNRTAATVGGTAALGAIIGAIAGGGTGAAIGAASGAAVGTGVQVMTRGQVLKIPAETILEFRLQAPLTIDASQ
jgi:hypothetical protein